MEERTLATQGCMSEGGGDFLVTGAENFALKNRNLLKIGGRNMTFFDGCI